jgi:exosome complex component RRP4
MVSIIKKETGCQITIGQNGFVLVSGKNPQDEQRAIMALYTIENESHTSGLTSRITEMLKNKKEGA